jgi:hypothetical protein
LSLYESFNADFKRFFAVFCVRPSRLLATFKTSPVVMQVSSLSAVLINAVSLRSVVVVQRGWL